MTNRFRILSVRRMRKRDLSEVKKQLDEEGDYEVSDGEKGPPIEEKIRPLLEGLNVWQIRTILSCEGHQDRGHGHPWVTIEWKDIGKVARVILEWNYGTKKKIDDPTEIVWIIDPRACPMIRPSLKHKQPLKALQEDAVRFGNYLKDLLPDHDWTK